MVRTLKAPAWPEEILDEIDQAVAARGRDVYTTVDASRYSCASCHNLADANILFQPYMAQTVKALFEEMQLSPLEQAVYSGFRIYNPGKEPGPDYAAYHARPLPGVWATAPFLHNGSARTLTELFKPAAERETFFYVGTSEYDPVNVGYLNDDSDDRAELFDTSWTGNSAQGHEYGTGFSDAQKADLVEFLKTL